MISRRKFIASSTGALASALVLQRIDKRLLGDAAPCKLRVALAGLGARGRELIAELSVPEGPFDLIGLCDVDSSRLARGMALFAGSRGGKVKAFANFGDMLRKARPDAVVIATPDHWHSEQVREAVSSGVHVWVEPSFAVNFDQLAILAEINKGSDPVIFPGRISRESEIAGELLSSGLIGEVRSISVAAIKRVANLRRPVYYGSPPEGLDWLGWCGPAVQLPFSDSAEGPEETAAVFAGGWRRHGLLSPGPIGYKASAEMALVARLCNDSELVRVSSMGCQAFTPRARKSNDRQFSTLPDQFVSSFEFKSGLVVSWTQKEMASERSTPYSIRVLVRGSKGSATIDPAQGVVVNGRRIRTEASSDRISILRFASAIRSGEKRRLSDFELRGSRFGLLANASYRLQRPLNELALISASPDSA